MFHLFSTVLLKFYNISSLADKFHYRSLIFVNVSNTEHVCITNLYLVNQSFFGKYDDTMTFVVQRCWQDLCRKDLCQRLCHSFIVCFLPIEVQWWMKVFKMLDSTIMICCLWHWSHFFNWCQALTQTLAIAKLHVLLFQQLSWYQSQLFAYFFFLTGCEAAVIITPSSPPPYVSGRTIFTCSVGIGNFPATPTSYQWFSGVTPVGSSENLTLSNPGPFNLTCQVTESLTVTSYYDTCSSRNSTSGNAIGKFISKQGVTIDCFKKCHSYLIKKNNTEVVILTPVNNNFTDEWYVQRVRTFRHWYKILRKTGR